MAVTVRTLKHWIEKCGLSDDDEVYIDDNLRLIHDMKDMPGYYYLDIGDPGCLDEEEELKVINEVRSKQGA